jgi:magnesium transporter
LDRADLLTTDFAQKHPDAFAKILGRGEPADIARVLRSLPPSMATAIIARLPTSRVTALLALGKHPDPKWLSSAPLDDTLMLLSRLPRENCLALINSLGESERRHELLQFLKYPAHSLGALVSAVPVRVMADMPAHEALAELRQLDSGDPGLLTVVRGDGRYLGTLDLWSLLAKDPPPGQVRDYTLPTPALHPETSIVSARDDADWNNNNCLPVVDHEGRLLGAVTRASVFAAVREHASSDGATTDMFQVLLADIVHFFGDVLERMLGDRKLS